jgi:DNA polymerase-3 subunit chi
VTSIEFYHDAPDKIAVACRLIGRLYGEGRRVMVFAPEPRVADQLDRMLWMQPAIGFFPHVRADSPLAAHTPIVIGGTLESLPHDDVLVNLDGELPPGFARFERLIEIVGQEEADRLPARARFKFYRDRGYPLTARGCSELP